MIIKNFYMLILLLLVSNISAQSLVFKYEFGNFNDANSFSFSTAGYFYVSDREKNEITKIDTIGNVSKIVGGYGWSESLFDNPIDVFTNVLNVYVSDYNNNRIQIFDKDLNFITEIINSDKIEFRFPTCSAASNQGDIFILDSDNKRILKLNRNGNFILTIGDIDAGKFQLSSPSKFCVDNNSNLYVINKNRLFVFDQFGNGLKIIDLNFTPENINSIFNTITIVEKDKILLAKVDNNNEISFSGEMLSFDGLNDIKDGLVFNNKLYILTKKNIQVFDLINR
ncbi:MAG: NHL repeat-containing protein [Stygiobacter sp.]